MQSTKLFVDLNFASRNKLVKALDGDKRGFAWEGRRGKTHLFVCLTTGCAQCGALLTGD